jgi:hypothetical protein
MYDSKVQREFLMERSTLIMIVCGINIMMPLYAERQDLVWD